MYTNSQQQLKELEHTLTERLENISGGLKGQHSADFAEQVTERENDDVLRNLQEETRIELNQVRTALKRMDSGEYGVCSKCGEDIDPARLEALPYATLCIRCAG